MKLSTTDCIYFNIFNHFLGSIGVGAIANLYKEKAISYDNEAMEGGFMKIDIRTVPELSSLMEYGRLRALMQATDESAFIYQVDIFDPEQPGAGPLSRDKVRSIEKIAELSYAKVVRVNTKKSLFINLVFIIPDPDAPNDMSHVVIQKLLKEQNLPYVLTKPEFSYGVF